MRKILARIDAVLRAHPRWATQLTPANAIAAGIVWYMFAFVPPRSPQMVPWAIGILAALTACVALVTARDLGVYMCARQQAADLDGLKTIQYHGYGFFAWLCEQKADDRLLRLASIHTDVAGMTPQERFDLAWHYERYSLVVICQRRALRVLAGAGLLVLFVLYSLWPPTKLTHLCNTMRGHR